MTRDKFINELGEMIDLANVKVVFKKQSPYLRARGWNMWEAWLYNGKSKHGYLITEEDWQGKDEFNILQAFTD